MTRQAEDVQDEIYNISPVDNPFCSMAMTIRATGKIHEWTEDILQPTVKNAKVEGAAAGNDQSQPATELQNYCQIMDKVAEITGTSERVKKYGRDSEMAYQLELRYGELANDEESAAVGDAGGTGRQVAVAGNSSTAREFASFPTQLDASVKVDAAAATTVAELEAALIAGHLASFKHGGRPDTVLTDPLTAGYFANFALSAGRTRDLRNEKTLVNCVDLYVSTYGELDLVLDLNMATDGDADNMILGVDFNYAATPVLRATDDWAIGKEGDSDKRQVLRESTIAALNTKAHFAIENVPANLTVS
jgi:hypothetical protein